MIRSAALAAVVVAMGLDEAMAFQASPFVGRSSAPLAASRRAARSAPTMVATPPKEGSGSNRMTETGFAAPLVKKVDAPYGVGYEYTIIEDLQEKKLNLQEKVKLASPGLSVMQRLEDLAALAKEKGGAQHLDEDEITYRLKWMGLFHRAKQAPGTFMWRLRVPNGIVTSEQLKAVGEVINSYDTGAERSDWAVVPCGDVTTRMNIQLRGVRLEDLPAHWKKLRSVGLFSVQSGMDNVRNLVGNPLAGIDPLEIIDTRAYCDEFTNKLTNNGEGNPEYSNLPRKFNVCYVGSNEMFEHPDINDIAYIPAKNAAGEMGWNIEVGGLLTGTRCDFAIPMHAWVPLNKHWELGDAILTTFRDYGYRYNPRTKCRLMYLIDDMGMDLFRSEVAKRYKASTGEDLPKEGSSLVPKVWERRELIGVHKQNDGANWVGLRVPVGRIYGDECVTMAALAEKYGKGELRLTVEENVIVPHIQDSNVDAFLKEVAEKVPRWRVNPGKILKGSVSCTGTQFCGFANINTKGNAIEIAERLDAKYEIPVDCRIHWTGCPNTCAQIQIGDIGLLGTKGKDKDGNIADTVDIYTGGGIGQTSSIGTVYKKGIVVDDTLEAELGAILEEKFGAKVRAGYVHSDKPRHPRASD